MEINEIKRRFKNKSYVDIKDVDIALKAVPFLVREIERLEIEIQRGEERIKHLDSILKRRPPLNKSGKRGKSSWETDIDEKRNLLYLKLKGIFDASSAKSATNNVISIIPNLRVGFDFINDVSEFDLNCDNRVKFHLKKLTYSLKKMGLKRIVLIVPTGEDALKQIAALFGKAERNLQSNYQVNYVNSRDEAESLIDNANKFLRV
ncbi:MAG: hypothetical protein HQK76_14300 [Desulfobacterales bacterium]|nr:hypothetical protein [Desulfobacterales bacterium]